MAYRRNNLRMEDLHSVKVDGISEYVKTEEIEEAFSRFGTVQDVYVPRDFRSNRNKGFGFVRFQHKDEAEDAANADITLDGKKVDMTLATRGKRDMSFRDRSPRREKGGGRRDSRRRDSRGRGGRRDSRGRGGRGRN